MKRIYLFISILFAIVMSACQGEKPTVASLKVEMQENPEGVVTTQPRFSWQITSYTPDLMQTAYQIQVASSEEDLMQGKNLLWDTKKVESDQSILIPYEGSELSSRQVCFWRVKVFTNRGNSNWSAIGRWSMALLNDSDWQAKWIGEDSLSNSGETMKGDTRLAARYLRKAFTTDKEVKRAVLYISGLGSNEAYINGKRVSEDVFAPTVSWYPERVYFNTYDVTNLISPDANVIAVKLGNGRYFGMRGSAFNFDNLQVFGLPSLLAQLEIEYSDGSSQVVVSDESWKVTSKGPIVANNEYDGEEYDANLEMPGWDTTTFDDSSWQQADLMPAPKGKLTAQPNPNLRVMEEIKPVKITQLPDGKYILDMGQNMVGWLKIEKLNGKKGQPITMRFAELLNPDSTLYLANIRGAKVTDIYTPAKDGEFSWEPSFVYHGFRFVEISGLDAMPDLSVFTGKVVYDQMETTGQFKTNNEIINQTFKNAYWGIRGNYRGMPTDCPQRDERMGWLGDRATGCFGEAFVFDNALLYGKWVQDIEDSQSPEGSISVVSPRYWTIYNDDVTWPAAYFYAANMLYHQYGDSRPITKHYDSMKRYLERIQQVSMQDYILTKDTYGDWCMPPESQQLIHSKDPARKTAGPILSTTMYYSLLNLMTDFARLTGNEQDIAGYQDLAAKIKEAYNNRYFDADSAKYDNNTVTANILSLRLGLVPEGYEQRVFDNVVKKTEVDFDGHVSTGVLGIQQLMRGLTQYGNVDLAYKIATNDTYPSWGYMIRKGATTIWELWNGDTADPAMNSGNHVMLLGDLIIWYYEDLAGIKNAPESIAYKKLLMEPKFPEGLSHVKASYNSVYGEIKSEWTKENNSFTWDIVVPANTSATVKLPKQLNIASPSGKGIHKVTETDSYIEIELGSGRYQLRSK
ncbi:MAG TPA: family 78 glycoside hydrolase catalytic domain [Dysgonamonadaceae bacterium]|nr:family 78 glycoside hydrolase catalytic domain [Dysgonamonadaceae bacterium]HPD44194.1 family 78 glycoside hydrolase catalytic domain [Dysgonamonadaceae bacterium]HRU13822.1 family 78 glycoside hydrolase catalytic domain [Dysgonamonadaceae bacterium]